MPTLFCAEVFAFCTSYTFETVGFDALFVSGTKVFHAGVDNAVPVCDIRGKRTGWG
jgi:hypothetical protein